MITNCDTMIAAVDPSNWIWILATLAVLLIGGPIAWAILRWRFGPGRRPKTAPAAFDVTELENMHAQGQITDQEFQRLRKKLAR